MKPRSFCKWEEHSTFLNADGFNWNGNQLLSGGEISPLRLINKQWV